jgi:hypothetical protein
MRGYFGLGQLSASEKSDILNQHKSLYNGYQTMQPQVSNTQPLYVYDFAGDKDGMVVNNKGEVKKYTNMGINEQVENNEVCDECGAMIMDGMCNECGYGHMEESELEEGNMCEQCGGTMKENVCEQCGSGKMEEGTGHLDDIYNVRDLNLTKGDFDYVEGGGNDYGTFKGSHKNLYKEGDENLSPSFDSDGNFLGMVNNTEFDMDDENLSPSFDSDGNFLGMVNNTEDDMDVDDVEDAYDFVSNGPGGVYPVNEDDMYGYEPEMTYETMESAWADEEIDEQDVSGSQGIYGDMKRAYDFDSGGPGKGGPYQEFSYESELDEEDEFGFATHSGDFGGDDSEDEFGFATHSGDFGGDDSEDDGWEEIDVDMKESFITQKNKITEMFNRIGKFN